MNPDLTALETLHELLHYDARKFTNGEILLRDELDNLVAEATSLKLKLNLQKYQRFIQQHITRLEHFFVEENINSLGINNYVMKAFIAELEMKVARCDDSELADSCILAGIQGINHFIISLCGTASAFAKETGREKYAEIFHDAEVNEKEMDNRLSQLAIHEINAIVKTRMQCN